MLNNSIILLTCCMNPGNMHMTVLTDKDERKNQYYEAFDFYLQNTDCPIVIIENTGFAIDRNYLDNPRIEYITFMGNNFDIERGKGYGELLILEHAIKHSHILKNSPSSSIIKITGRLKILSIAKHLKQIQTYNKQNLVFADIEMNFRIAYSYFFIANKFFYENYFFSFKNQINDSKGFYFEHALAKSIKTYIEDKNIFRHLLNPIDVYGYSGTTGKYYSADKGLIKTIKMKIKYIYLRFKSM